MGTNVELHFISQTETEIMHKADVLAIHCIDLRFQEAVQNELPNWGKFDRISWPGASKDFTNVQEAALISLNLHSPDEVIIIEHKTCGAYGKDDSDKTHKKNANKLKSALLKEYPDLKVKTLIATMEGIKAL